MASDTTIMLAASLAVTLMSPEALTVESAPMWASTELAIELITRAPAPPVPLELPAPAAPTFTSSDVDVAWTFTAPPVALSVEPSTKAATELLTLFQPIATPTPVPLLETPRLPATAIIVEASRALTVTPVTRVAVVPRMWAVTELLMALTPTEPAIAEPWPEETAPPTAIPTIFARSSASTLSAPIVPSVEDSRVAATVFAITLIPMARP